MTNDLPEAYRGAVQAALLSIDPNALFVDEEWGEPIIGIASMAFITARMVIDLQSQIRGVPEKIYVCVVASRALQACAMQLGDGEYCIAIWAGSLISPQVAMSRLLRGNALAKAFNLPIVEVAAQPEQLGDTYAAYQTLTMGRDLDLYENDKARADALGRVSTMSFEWLVLHEYGHILNGHLAVGLNVSGIRMIVEVLPDRDEDELKTSHTLEYDADQFATLQSLQLWLKRGGDGLAPIDDPVGVDQRIAVSMAGIYLMTRAFDDRTYGDTDLFRNDHPPGSVRAQFAGGLLATLWESNPAKSRVVGVATDVLLGLEIAVAEATGIKPNAANILMALKWVDSGYMDTLWRRWARLRPLLQKSKLGTHNLAAAQRDPD